MGADATVPRTAADTLCDSAMDSLEILEKRLREIEEKIRQAKLQLPAHSIKPPVMITLLDLEDERDAILEQIGSIKKKNSTKNK